MKIFCMKIIKQTSEELLGKIGWLGGLSSPDLAYNHVVLSTKLGKATIGDMKMAIKVVKKLR